MSLGVALQISQNSLANVSRQTSAIARNITSAGDPSYSRRYSVVESHALGSRVSVLRVQVDQNLNRSSLEARSQFSSQSLLAQELARLGESLNGADGEVSIFASMGKLQDSIQVWSADPGNALQANATLQDAKNIAARLNASSAEVQRVRSVADQSIARGVASLNGLLAEFQQANSLVVDGSLAGEPDNDALDRRTALLGEISKYVPVTTISRENDDMSLFTGGAVLFETVPRTVEFARSASLLPGQTGAVVTIDGLPVRAGQNAQTSARGTIAANLQLRDGILPQMQLQLDETARSLIAVFSETSTSSATQTGLFSYASAPVVPPDGLAVSGISASISINSAFDPVQGGSINLLRDGGANGIAYVANVGGESGFADRLITLGSEFGIQRTYDVAAGLESSQSLSGYANSSVGWLDGLTADAGRERDVRMAVHERLQINLSEAQGVDIDAELSRMLELERTYEASARMISAVDEMLATLLSVVR